MTKQELNSRRKRTAGKKRESVAASPVICPRCGGPILEGQIVGPLFAAKLVTWEAHPVLSKPPTIRGMVSVDGSGSRHDLTLHEQLIQRASMGGPRDRAALAHFEEVFSEAIARALVAHLREGGR
jgi:hypothetical protein